MATLSRTFSVKNGLDVANTIVFDSNRNLTNVANATITGDVVVNKNVAGDLVVTAKFYSSNGTAYLNGDLVLAGGDLISTETANLLNTTTTTVNFGREANVVNIGANTGNTFIYHSVDVSGNVRVTQDFRVVGDAYSNNFISTRTALSAPSTSTFAGERLRLFDFAQAGRPNYAIGVEGSHIWLGVDSSANTEGWKFYGNTSLAARLSANGIFEVANNISAKNIKLSGTGTAVDASQGNILTNQVTGTQFNFLSGLNTVSLTASPTTAASYTLRLPANTGANGQLLTSDGTGNTIWSSSIYDVANNAANTVRVSSNGGGTLSNKQLNFVNTSTALVTIADSGNGNANISISVVGGGAIGQSYDQANAAYAQANSSYTQANGAYNQATGAYAQANLAYDQANAAACTAAVAYSQANNAYAQANAAYNSGNTKVASIVVSGNGLFVSNTTTANVNDYTIGVNVASTTLRGTTILIDAVNSSDTGNAATANAVKTAWDYANTKLSLSGGTINGSLNVSGNLIVTGNTTFINATSYVVNDPLIFLAANNDISDVVDIGFVGAKNTGGVGITHTGLARDAGDTTWYLFDNLPDSGHQNNVVDFANSTYALLRANLYAQQLNVVNGFANIAVPLTVGGNTTLSNVTVTGSANILGNLTVTGTTIYSNTVSYTSAVNVNSTLTVTGTTTLANTIINGNLAINDAGTGLTVGNVNVTHTLTVSSLKVTTNTVTTSSSGQVVLDIFPLTSLASAKYFIQANSSTTYHTTEMIVVHDGTNVFLTEYGTIQTGAPLGTFNADIDSGNVRLLFTATNNINTIRSARYGLIP